MKDPLTLLKDRKVQSASLKKPDMKDYATLPKPEIVVISAPPSPNIDTLTEASGVQVFQNLYEESLKAEMINISF